MRILLSALLALAVGLLPARGLTWHDETHLAIAKAAGYRKWYNAAGPDITKIKAGDVEQRNHYVNNPPGTVVTAAVVMDQALRYNDPQDRNGHLYGAIIGALRAYRTSRLAAKYAAYHLAFCAHYVGDLSQPLHNSPYGDYNRQNHVATDGIIEDEVFTNLPLIEIYPIRIRSEADLAREIARIANRSLALGERLAREQRLISRQEAYIQIGHSASLLKAILAFVEE